jgi:hypothetical protein
VHYKVPTLLVYESKKDRNRHATSWKGRPFSWGLLAAEDEDRYSGEKETKQFFKLFLDKDVLLRQRPQDLEDTTHQDVCDWFRDYLSQIYRHIEDRFVHTRSELWQSNVRFVFSVPTTWDAEVIDRFMKIIREAGFGKKRGHSAAVTLTEAHAAAIGIAHDRKAILEKGQIVLVCDAGGGTTDIALLEVVSARGEPLRLAQLDKVSGVHAGSTLIDHRFEDYAAEKLKLINRDRGAIIPNVALTARAMAAHRKFQTSKRSLSLDTRRLNVPFRIPIDDLPRNFSHAAAGVEKRCLTFDPAGMARLFDEGLERIYDKLDRQLDSMAKLGRLQGRSVRYLVLSGGLGSSAYVREQLRLRYCQQDRPCIRGMTLLQSDEPQLAVARGLVVDEMSATLQSWISPRSYGVVGMKEFDKNEHLDVDRDDGLVKLTGKVWAKNQIHWVIKQGQRLTRNNAITIRAKRMLDPAQEETGTGWKSRMVVSDLPVKDLPDSTSKPGCDKFCVIESDLSRYVDDFESSRGSRWLTTMRPGRSSHHVVARYDIRAVVGAAAVEFELWYKDKKCSETKEINVAWGAGNSLDMFH